MKNDEHIIGEAVRIEYTESNGDIFVVFKITDPNYKHIIKTKWNSMVEFKINKTKLILEEE